MTMNFTEFYQNGRAWARRLEVEGLVSEARFERAFDLLKDKYDSSRKAAIVAVLFPCFAEKHGVEKKDAMSLALMGGDYIHLVSYHPDKMPEYLSGDTPANGTARWLSESDLAKDTVSIAVDLLVKHRHTFNSVVVAGLTERSSEITRQPSLANIIINRARMAR